MINFILHHSSIKLALTFNVEFRILDWHQNMEQVLGLVSWEVLPPQKSVPGIRLWTEVCIYISACTKGTKKIEA